jgi:hypothetical protein
LEVWRTLNVEVWRMMEGRLKLLAVVPIGLLNKKS